MKKTDYERHMKKCLEKRRIQPKEDLWESLVTELDKNGKNKRFKSTYKLVGMVAVLIGIFWGSMLFRPARHNQVSKAAKKVDAVDPVFHPKKPKAVQEVSKTSQFSVLFQHQEGNLPMELNTSEKQEITLATSVSKQPKQKSSPQIVNPNSEKAIQAKESLSHLKGEQESDSIEDYRKAYSDQDETEILLRKALYQEFLADMKNERDSVRILALGEQLLKEINIDLEKEEDRAFRDKIWEVIQKGWDKAKSAVAVNPGTP